MPFYQAVNAINFQIAGLAYRLRELERAQVHSGDTLTLTLEPTNPYDKHAIAVHKGEHQLGYVPRTHNLMVEEILKEHPDGCACHVTTVFSGTCCVRLIWPVATEPVETDTANTPKA